ncbi:hypothetical protein Tco_1330714, partial [Tanacetum coccineum]
MVIAARMASAVNGGDDVGVVDMVVVAYVGGGSGCHRGEGGDDGGDVDDMKMMMKMGWCASA